jgi:hypothetical protein
VVVAVVPVHLEFGDLLAVPAGAAGGGLRRSAFHAAAERDVGGRGGALWGRELLRGDEIDGLVAGRLVAAAARGQGQQQGQHQVFSIDHHRRAGLG